MTTIINGAPMVYFQGTEDLSDRIPVREPEAIPTHLPHVFIYAQKGPTTPQIVVGNERTQMYGKDTFDLRKKWATHQTVLSNVLNAEGNAQMIERILPVDAGPAANFLLWLEIKSEQIPVYQRDPLTGKYVLDEFDDPVQVENAGTPVTIAGYSARWVVSNYGYGSVETANWGTAVSKAGTGGATLYPILQFAASSAGEYFNNSGLRFWAPQVETGLDTKAMGAMGVYPLRMQAIRRADSKSTPVIVQTEFGETSFDFTLKPGVINPDTDAKYSLKDIFLDKYRNVTDTRYPIKLGDFGAIHVYDQYIDTVLNLIWTAEKEEINSFSDLTDATNSEQRWLLNLFTGLSSRGVPYATYYVDPTARLTENVNFYAAGGFDGTLDELGTITTEGHMGFPALVSQRVSEYANPNSVLQDIVKYPSSIVYDSGFPLTTKQAMMDVMAIRKDMAVVQSTYVVGSTNNMSASDENSVATALRAQAQLYPESEFFGTHVTRCLIMGRNGVMRGSQYPRRLPLTIEIAAKAARMMGASNGKWNEKYLFDKAPNNEVELFTDVNITFTPATVKYKDWDAGLNWVQSYSRSSVFIPALKTVYNNDTSVLNSFFVVMGCIELQKVGQRVFNDFSGVVSLTNAQLVERVNAEVERRTNGRFANLFVIRPNATITSYDEQRGYSWTLPIELYANNMKSVMTLSVKAYRMSDLATNTTTAS